MGADEETDGPRVLGTRARRTARGGLRQPSTSHERRGEQREQSGTSRLRTLEPVVELELGTITVDSADARALATWWAQVLDCSVDDYPEVGIHVVRTDRLKGLNLAFQQARARHRVRTGFTWISVRLIVPRVSITSSRSAHGASTTTRSRALPGQVLADPDGNHFCVSDQTSNHRREAYPRTVASLAPIDA
jgi:Glyoxalase-like domain